MDQNAMCLHESQGVCPSMCDEEKWDPELPDASLEESCAPVAVLGVQGAEGFIT